jgi:hypothetical protein
LRFNQIGGAAVSVFAAPRKREGRKEDPSILIEAFKESFAVHYNAIDRLITG